MHLDLYSLRDQLKRNCSLKMYNLNLKIQDLNNFDTYLAQELIQRPVDYIAVVSALIFVQFVVV